MTFPENLRPSLSVDYTEFYAVSDSVAFDDVYDIVIDEIVNQSFVITSISSPIKGSTTMLDVHSRRWNIPELGVSSSESATLDFFVRHVGQQSGAKLVNQSITYSDREGNVVSFPKPTVSVECDIVVYPEDCPTPVDLTVAGCQDSVVVDLGDVNLTPKGELSRWMSPSPMSALGSEWHLLPFSPK